MPAETDHEARFKLAEALAANPGNVSAAARAAGYSRRQVYRVKDDPEFVRMLEAAKVRRVEAAASGAAVSGDDLRASIGYLRAVVDGEEDGDPNRITAAKALLAAGGVIKRTPPKRADVSEAPPDVPAVAAKPLTAAEASKKWRVV